MSINIKDPEAHRLAQEIARATGEAMTRVVTEALRERLSRLERRSARAGVEELLAIAERAASHVKHPHISSPSSMGSLRRETSLNASTPPTSAGSVWRTMSSSRWWLRANSVLIPRLVDHDL